MSASVDALIDEIAAQLVWGLISKHNRPLVASVRARLVERTSNAIRQAVEQEWLAIERDIASSESPTMKWRP